MKHSGFTLLEVMIALIIIALSMSAVFYVITLCSRQTIYLQQKIIFYEMAENIVNEYRAHLRNNMIDQGQLTLLHQTGVWFSTIEKVSGKAALKLQVIVRENYHKEAIAEVTTWLPIYHAE